MKLIKFVSFFLIVATSCVLAQSNTIKQDSLASKPKSKKQLYIENYIAQFPYKNSDIYAVIKQTNLWDTTGAVPVISANTISINMSPKRIHENKEPKAKDEK